MIRLSAGLPPICQGEGIREKKHNFNSLVRNLNIHKPSCLTFIDVKFAKLSTAFAVILDQKIKVIDLISRDDTHVNI